LEVARPGRGHISIRETGFPRRLSRCTVTRAWRTGTQNGVSEREEKDVRVCKINMRECDERREYRNIRILAERLNFNIPERAWNNLGYEYNLLHHGLDSAVVSWIDL